MTRTLALIAIIIWSALWVLIMIYVERRAYKKGFKDGKGKRTMEEKLRIISNIDLLEAVNYNRFPKGLCTEQGFGYHCSECNWHAVIHTVGLYCTECPECSELIRPMTEDEAIFYEYEPIYENGKVILK